MPTRIVKTDPEYPGFGVRVILDTRPTRQPYLIRQGITSMHLCELTNGERVWFIEDELETY
jgi:hypothetical protein